MRKLLLLDEVFPTGEQTIQAAILWHNGRAFRDAHGGITKHASEATEYIKNVVPEPGKTHLLVLALGSEETYGPNRNGDGFPERPVTAKKGQGYWIEPGQELTKHYKSFEKAHAFQHHQNKDPAKASGHVKKAFWNPKMHRVELLVVVDNKKDPEWVQRVNDGEFPAVSMGCRIKYDVCARCGNRAPTRASYCDHAKYALNQVNPDGTKNYVHNPSPDFFDLSRVFRPADRTGYTLKKVAHVYEVRSSAELGDLIASLEAKSAAIRKISDIDKVVRGENVGSSSNLDDEAQSVIRKFRRWIAPRMDTQLPMEVLDKVSVFTPGTLLATLHKLGMALTTREWVGVMAQKLAHVRLDDYTLNNAVGLQPQIRDLFAASPALLDKIAETGVLTATQADPALEELLAPFRAKRAGLGEMMYRKIVPEGYGRPEEQPMSDMLTYTEPTTGKTFRTTRGAALQAQDFETRHRLLGQIGGAALIGAGLGTLNRHPLVGLGAGALGYHMLRSPSGHGTLQTNEGVPISTLTEFAPHPRIQDPEERTASIVLSLVRDAESVPTATFAKFAAVESLLPLVKEGASDDIVSGIELDLNTVAITVGRLIFS